MSGARTVALNNRTVQQTIASLPSSSDNVFNHMMAASTSTSTSSGNKAGSLQLKRCVSSLHGGVQPPSGGHGRGYGGGRGYPKKGPRVDHTGAPYAPGYKKVQGEGQRVPIIVDGFQYASEALSDCYFLTHFHSDHYIGLDRSFDYGRIYCSGTTAALVKLRLNLKAKNTNVVIMQTKYSNLLPYLSYYIYTLMIYCPRIAVCTNHNYPYYNTLGMK
jgi:hypothetical protein